MYSNDIANVSPEYSKDYLKRLFEHDNLSADSDQQVFESAIEIFRDRMHGRFFDQIRLLSHNIEKNGFAIMALECLLVETFAQFRKGLADTNNCSRDTYCAFLRKLDVSFEQVPQPSDFETEDLYLKEVRLKKNGEELEKPRDNAYFFYKRIRCGILHQAQSGNNSGLTIDSSPGCVCWHNMYFMVNVERFMELMNAYFDKYRDELRNEHNYALRNNFIKKMRYICKLDD